MASARFSKNNVEFIGCGVRRIYTTNGELVIFGFCQAMTAASVNGFCSSEDPALVDALDAISDYAFITFTWNSEGTCTAIGTSTQSVYIPAK